MLRNPDLGLLHVFYRSFGFVIFDESHKTKDFSFTLEEINLLIYCPPIQISYFVPSQCHPKIHQPLKQKNKKIILSQYQLSSCSGAFA